MTTQQLQESNAKFNALPPMEKRLAICREILLTIETGTFVPGWGYGMIEGAASIGYRTHYLSHLCLPIGDLQEHLMEGLKCKGCAKAAIIVAQARLGDNIRIDPVSDNGNTYPQTINLAHRISREIFGEVCAHIIEALYEDHYPKSCDKDAYYEFLDKLPRNNAERMKAIYQHIIDNDGYIVVGEEKF